MNAISRPSTNEIAAARSQKAAGRGEGEAAAREERQHQHRDRRDARTTASSRAPGESRPTTSSSMPAIAKNAISSSNQYPRATFPMPAHGLNVLHARRARLLPE